LVCGIRSGLKESEFNEEFLIDSLKNVPIRLYVSKIHCQSINVGVNGEEKNIQHIYVKENKMHGLKILRTIPQPLHVFAWSPQICEHYINLEDDAKLIQ